MNVVSWAKNWRAKHADVLCNLWHWSLFCVIFSVIPLFLTITFEMIIGINSENLIFRFYSDLLLATFALAVSVCGEATNDKNFRFPISKFLSGCSMAYCIIVYLVFYELSSIVTKLLGSYITDDIRNLLANAAGRISDITFYITLFVYVLNLLLGFYLSCFGYKKRISTAQSFEKKADQSDCYGESH